MSDKTDTTEVVGTPLVTQADIDNQASPEELRLPTNAELMAKTEPTSEDADESVDGDELDAEDDDELDAELGELEDEVVEDPGPFVPGDYGFEVTVYDDEGKHPKTVKINSLDQWDELLETNPNLGTGVAVSRAQRAVDRMDRNIERDRSEWEAKKAEYEEAVQQSEAQSQILDQWEAEVNYLIDKGELPPITAKLRKADWSDPEVAKHPAVKAQIELLRYMQQENVERQKSGLKPMRSVLDAHEGFARGKGVPSAASSPQGQTTVTSPKSPTRLAPKGIAVGRVGALD